jgi:hypothetical protein
VAEAAAVGKGTVGSDNNGRHDHPLSSSSSSSSFLQQKFLQSYTQVLYDDTEVMVVAMQ